MARQCPDCGTSNSNHAESCVRCGGKLVSSVDSGSPSDKTGESKTPWYMRLFRRRGSA